MIDLRNQAVEMAIDALGLWPILDTLLDAWQALPAAVREAIAAAQAAGRAWSDFQDDPSVENLVAFGVAAVRGLSTFASGLVTGVLNGEITSRDMVDWAGSLGSNVNSAVADILRSAGLGAAADLVEAWGGTPIELATTIAASAAEIGDEFVSALASGDVAGAASTLATAPVDIASDIGSAAVDLGEDIIDFIF
jgi:hypothetical protein